MLSPGGMPSGQVAGSFAYPCSVCAKYQAKVYESQEHQHL